jgi:hypothetical protein
MTWRHHPDYYPKDLSPGNVGFGKRPRSRRQSLLQDHSLDDSNPTIWIRHKWNGEDEDVILLRGSPVVIREKRFHFNEGPPDFIPR